MPDRDPAEVRRLLEEASRGGEGAADKLLPLLYDDLRALAGGLLRRERKGHTLQPTALVHEAYVRLMREANVPWQDRAWFRAVAARAMRQVLIEHARRKNAQRRGGGEWVRVTMELEAPAPSSASEFDVLALHEALDALGRLSQRQASVVELRFFGGLTIPETAHVLGVSRSTVEDDWAMARAFLSAQLEPEAP